MRTHASVSVFLAVLMVCGSVSATRPARERPAFARDYPVAVRPARETADRPVTRDKLDRILHRAVERSRPGDDGIGGLAGREARASAAASGVPPSNVESQGVLDRQHLEKARAIVDAAMAKHSKGHATTRESTGGNDSRKARESAAKLRAAGSSSAPVGVLDRIHLDKRQ
jgi:hypothetical protein